LDKVELKFEFIPAVKGNRAGGGDATDHFRWMRTRKNSTETQQSGYAPRSGPDVKMEKVVPKMARRREAHVWNNPEGDELRPADDVHIRHCNKNFKSDK